MIDIIIAFKSMVRNLSMTIITISLIFLTMLMFSVLVVSIANTYNLTQTVAEEIKVYAYVDKELTEKEINDLVSEVANIDGITDVVLSNKEDELNRISEMIVDESTRSSFEEIFNEDHNPLYDVLDINLDPNMNRNELIDNINNIDGIGLIVDPTETTDSNIIVTLKKINYGLIILVGFLFVITLLVINNTVNLTIRYRKDEIEIMRLVGGTKFKILKPFLFEGVFIGFVGGFLSALVIYFIYNNMYLQTTMSKIQLVEPSIIAHLLWIVPIASTVIGVSSSFYTVLRQTKI